MPKSRESEAESLHSLTLALLRESRESTFEVATGTGLTYSWIVAFAAGRMDNPSVNKVQRLYEYLTGKPLLRAAK